eukprot:GHVU01191115.1.p2 GENE.GHVU01191115.1~~GHVU01191115.1.p2  ORF type:complete len:493 (-),score=40.06 GHVU01191115.1:421-1899(-)
MYLYTNFKNYTFINKYITKIIEFKKNSKYIQELMNIGFEYCTKFNLTLNLNSLKNYIFNKNIYNYNNIFYKNNNFLHINSNVGNTMFYKNNENFKNFFNLLNYYNIIKPINTELDKIILSGAKGNLLQLYQLTGFKGYIFNVNNSLSCLPILQNYSKSLNIYEFIISSYGSRKGVVNSAIITADSGYLTRRLVESINYLHIKEFNCKSQIKFKYYKNFIYNGYIFLIPLQYLINKYIDIIIYNDVNIKYYFFNNVCNSIGFENIILYLRNVFSCLTIRNICSKCFCYRFNKILSNLSFNVGVFSAQALGEPTTQLTLKTFHLSGGLKYTTFNINYLVDKNKIYTIGIFKYINSNVLKFIINKKKLLKIYNKNYFLYSINKFNNIKILYYTFKYNIILYNLFFKSISLKLINSYRYIYILKMYNKYMYIKTKKGFLINGLNNFNLFKYELFLFKFFNNYYNTYNFSVSNTLNIIGVIYFNKLECIVYKNNMYN